MVQMVRIHSDKLEHPLREEILNLYKPFRWVPCFLHKVLEGSLKLRRKFSVIIEFEEGNYNTGCNEVYSVMERHIGNRINHYFERVSCCSANVTPNGLEEILSNCNCIKRVYLNREVKALLNVAVPSAKAKNITSNGTVRNTTLTGTGVNIAIVDTGIYPHRDLVISDFVDFINGRTEAYDDNGHGTHCAGDAASRSSIYTGSAPGATVVGVKVLDKLGSGSLDTVMQGVEWCIQYNENNPEKKIDIISMSLGSTAQKYGDNNDQDPMVKAVEAAWDAGIVVVVAAGNEGPDNGTIASPGISDKVITVGALDDRDTENREDDAIASFSSKGPTVYGEIKPDIVAPGVNIVSLRSPNSYLDKLQKTGRVENDYFVLSGTSMATPICAGVVALMIQEMKLQDQKIEPDRIKRLLKEGPDLWNYDDTDQ
jgi:serine protease AprX